MQPKIMKSKLYTYRIVKETFADGTVRFILLYKGKTLGWLIIRFLSAYVLMPIIIPLLPFADEKLSTNYKECIDEIKSGMWSKIHSSPYQSTIASKLQQEIFEDDKLYEAKMAISFLKRK